MSTDDYKKFCNHGKELTFKFDSIEAANHFKSWLCGSGEQQYWEWMECREQEDVEARDTVLEFNYHTGDSAITTESGRLDDERD